MASSVKMTVNPRTGRLIRVGGKVWQQIQEEKKKTKSVVARSGGMRRLPKKYTSRKRLAPAIPAKNCYPGEVELGRDGREWRIVVRKRLGVPYHVWVAL
jgi:hypothetical protein